MKSPGNLTFKQTDISKGLKNIEISTNTQYRGLAYCLKWSSHILFVRTNDTLITNPVRFTYYDKCYSTTRDIIGTPSVNNTNVTISYSIYETLDSKDFISLVFFDSDCYDGSCYYENSSGADIAGKDFEYNLKL